MRTIGADNEPLGILPTRQALNTARDQGLDLVMVSATADPPVARITDFGRYKYEIKKRDKENKKIRQEVKGIKMSPRIADNDIQTLLKKTREFLLEGHKIKVTCQFRAREITHPEIGHAKMIKFAESLAEISVLERQPTLDGKLMIMVMNPKPGIAEKKHAKDQNQSNSSQEVQGNGIGKDHAEEVREQPHVLQQEQGSEAEA